MECAGRRSREAVLPLNVQSILVRDIHGGLGITGVGKVQLVVEKVEGRKKDLYYVRAGKGPNLKRPNLNKQHKGKI